MFQIEDLLDVLSRIKDSVVALDNNCTITFANQAFADVMGYQPVEMVGKNIWQLLPASVGTPVHKNILEAIETKETRRFEWRGVYAISNWETTVYPSAEGVTIITTDVTKHRKALEALRASEESYRQLLQHAPTAICEFDYKTSRFRNVNDAMCQLLDYTKDELLSMDPLDLVNADYRRQFKARVKAEWVGKKADLTLEVAVAVKGGKEKWFVLNIKPIFGSNIVESALVIGHDVTERKKTEERLVSAKNELATILENINEGFFSLDKNWCFVYVNGKAANNVGYKAEELMGKNLWELFPQISCTLAAASYRRAMAERVTISFEEQGILTRRWYEQKVYPTSQGIAVFWRDITARKKTQEALLSERARLQTVVDNLPVGVMIADVSGKAFMLNKTLNNIWQGTKKLDSVKDYKQYSAWNAKTGAKITPSNWPISIALKTEKPTKEYELTIERFDGTKGTMLTSAVPIRDAHGKVVGAVGVGEDITQRNELKHRLEDYTKNLEMLVQKRTEELQDKERLAAIGTTAGMVGHDIRNPLQAIVGDVYLLKGYMDEIPAAEVKSEAIESLDSIEKNVEYINKIVADLQDYARPLNPEYINVNLSDVIAGIFRTTEIPDTIKLTIDITGLPQLRSDPIFIRRALTNLVNNALQAMPNGGPLKVQCYERDDKICVSVTDAGVGIPEDFKAKLFTPMMTTKAKGQGLGLAVVKRLIESLNGTVTFESQEGKGTTFTITLPR